MSSREQPRVVRDADGPLWKPPYDWEPPPIRTELLWAAVDFDGTIAESHWTPEDPNYEIGEPIPGAYRKAWELHREGLKIIVHTARPWSDYERIESWLTHHGFPFKRIVCGKLLANIYIDDRARHSDSTSWLPGVGRGA